MQTVEYLNAKGVRTIVEVHTNEAYEAISALAGPDMPWDTYNRIFNGIIALDRKVVGQEYHWNIYYNNIHPGTLVKCNICTTAGGRQFLVAKNER